MNYNEWAFHDIEPIYLQLVKKIECAILSTQLSAGEELPSIRAMAKLLNPFTRLSFKLPSSLLELQHAKQSTIQSAKDKATNDFIFFI